ncbi:formylglycine-generating enzyme family protein [Adonisia turfae]|uniref:Formylglycine-generating enzyme family protein n=1 Tax=Adonisia turfae CCMR0081 TaxID=2292702 RepID=A0A6M0RVY8_9CYAN|nr:formylglycine-generating enzyme family protein [Adonisia turfae]NEZ60339.1 formylglycine-generating enzyme family protein [Adonisia turfae CCMR0081]
MPQTLRRTPRTGRGYIEPKLEVSAALPLHMVLIPGGSFMMGSPEDEEGYEESESPLHKVTVSPFFMARYPVTQAQWKAVVAIDQGGSKLTADPSYFKGGNHPVETVSWYDAIEFCARLKQHTDRPYRLPTEAEWEYACRAGKSTPFAFGNTISPEGVNYNGNHTYGDGAKGEYREKTTPVDHFDIANAFGLSDTHGNVDEWCQDHWHSNYEGAPTDGSAWGDKEEDLGRVVRGGSWGSDPRYCRSASRDSLTPGIRSSYIGFRVVCSAPRIPQA